MSEKLVFNEKYHSYFLGKQFLPGVSSILKAAGLVSFEGIPEEILVRARDFGLACHKVCELSDLDTLDMATVDEPVIPYLTAWQKFKIDNAVEIEDIELPVFSEKWQYAGKLDRVVIMGGKRILLDIKSSASIYPSMAIQLKGYEIAYNEMTGIKIQGRAIIQLLKTGAYNVCSCKDESDEQVFLAAIQIYRWKKKNNIGGK